MTPIRNKVLVVDDDPSILDGIAIVLEARGYVVVARDSSIGTGAAILSEMPETALLDVEMPGLRGDALAKLLDKKSDFPMPWVIFHSSLPAEELERLVAETNAAGAIQKTDLASFVTTFEAMLKRLRTRALASRG